MKREESIVESTAQPAAPGGTHAAPNVREMAIENARLLCQLEERNREVSQALDQQTATSEILQVISGSPTDTAPVFEAILNSSARLCEADMGLVLRYESGVFQTIATLVPDPAFDAFLRQPITAGPLSGLGRVALTRAPVHIADLIEDDAYRMRDPLRMRSVELGGVRTWLGVPMLREGELIGAICIYRKVVRPFEHRQIEVLRTFADQAAIAVENVRLFQELERRNHDLGEALEQQTATAEVLRVISSSPSDLAPVFAAVAQNTARLCDAPDVVILTVDGDLMRRAASVGPFGQFIGAELAIPVSRESVSGRAIVDRRTIQVHDLAAEPEDEFPVGKELQRRYGHRTIIAIPLLRSAAALGVIVVLRTEVRPFTDRQLSLLQTFADQAIIAIENVRLFNATKEALETQTATAEILKVISESPTDVQPVFDAIAERAGVLCNAVVAGVTRFDGEWVHLVSFRGASAEAEQTMRGFFPMHPSGETMTARAIRDRAPAQTPDLLLDPEFGPKEVALRAGFRSILAVPMIKDGVVIGSIGVNRAEAGPFPERQVRLLQTFADQAVIAIENVRLFNETKEGLETQTATADILKVISESPTDVQPVFDAIAERAKVLCNAVVTGVARYDGELVHLVAYHGVSPEADHAMRSVFPMRAGGGQSASARAVGQRIPVQIPDVLADPEYGPKEAARQAGYRANLAVPMLKEGQVIGAIVVCRAEPGAFPDKQVKLLQTFGDQAIIAIENVRLFNALREQSEQLERASRHKSEFLANMSHELRTPLNAIIGFTRIVMRRSKDVLEPRQYENLEKILTSGQNLLALINSILDLAKVEAGRVDVHPADAELMQLLDSALRTIEPLLDANVKLIRTFHAPALPLFIDEEKLRQIVINLLSNAAKFTQRGSVRVTTEQNGDCFAISVADTGIGIAADKLETIFEEFEQAGATDNIAQCGTGLGLTIARRLARLMGGDITVTSTLGEGSTFTLALPLSCDRFGATVQ